MSCWMEALVSSPCTEVLISSPRPSLCSRSEAKLPSLCKWTIETPVPSLARCMAPNKGGLEGWIGRGGLEGLIGRVDWRG